MVLFPKLYVNQGSVVYSWNGDRRELVSSLDVGKLLSNSDIAEAMMCKPVHLTVLYSNEEFVFVGTNTGFIILLTLKLHHISTFHPFSKDVRSFCVYSQPIVSLAEQNVEEDSTLSTYRTSLDTSPTRLIAFGKNYIHLFDTNAQEQRRAYAILCTLNLN